MGNSGATIVPYFNAPANGSPIYVNFNHTDPEVTSRECASCHSVPAANAGPSYAKWKSATFHSVVPTVSTGKCVNCHYNIMPTDAFTTYQHATNLVTSTATGNLPVPTHAGVYVKQDCGACHGANTGKTWLGASAASPHTATFLATANCVSCHVASGGPTTYASGVAVGMPAGAVSMADSHGTISFYHISPTTVTRYGGTGTVTINGSYNLSQTACIFCHAAAAKAIEVPAGSTSVIKAAPTGTGWSGGVMGPSTTLGYHLLAPTTYTYTSGTGITAATGGSKPTTCSTCHEQARPSTNHNAGQDCGSCHTHQNPKTSWN